MILSNTNNKVIMIIVCFVPIGISIDGWRDSQRKTNKLDIGTWANGKKRIDWKSRWKAQAILRLLRYHIFFLPFWFLLHCVRRARSIGSVCLHSQPQHTLTIDDDDDVLWWNEIALLWPVVGSIFAHCIHLLTFFCWSPINFVVCKSSSLILAEHGSRYLIWFAFFLISIAVVVVVGTRLAIVGWWDVFCGNSERRKSERKHGKREENKI